jgi:hypothetical protein
LWFIEADISRSQGLDICGSKKRIRLVKGKEKPYKYGLPADMLMLINMLGPDDSGDGDLVDGIEKLRYTGHGTGLRNCNSLTT